MVFKLVDRARQSVSGAPGTGVITLGAAVSGYQTFSAAGINNGDTFPYSIDDKNNTWEYGIATFSSTAGGQITRAVDKSSSGTGVALSLTSSAVVSATVRAEDIKTQTTLVGLSDVQVNPGSGINGYSLVYDDTLHKWTDEDITGGGGGDDSLASLSDVSLSSPSNNQALLYQTGTPAKWKNETLAAVALSNSYSDLTGKPTIPTNSSFTLDALGNVSITSLTTNQSIKWNGTDWVNYTPSGGSSGVAVESGGTSVGTGITTLNFNTNLTASVSGSTATINASGGGGGGGAGFPFFSPLAATNYDTSASHDTTTATDVTAVGMRVQSAINTGSEVLELARISTSGWSTPWKVTARLILSADLYSCYGGFGLLMQDSSGVLLGMEIRSLNSGNIVYACEEHWNSPSSHNGTVTQDELQGGIPEWFQVGYDGTNYTLGYSRDGENFSILSTTGTLSGAPSYVGIGIHNYFNNTSQHWQPTNISVVCSYWDDPSHPATNQN